MESLIHYAQNPNAKIEEFRQCDHNPIYIRYGVNPNFIALHQGEDEITISTRELGKLLLLIESLDIKPPIDL